MHLIRNCIQKIIFRISVRLKKIKYCRKKTCTWMFASISVFILISSIYLYSAKKHYRPFVFRKQRTPFYQHSEKTPFCFNMSLGPRVVNKTKLHMSWVVAQLPMVQRGGFYSPKHCRSRHKVAILIPYRDRYDNLVIFLYHMHPLWQKQFLQYRVFVIEQYGTYKFNKGMLYNAGFIETQRYGDWDCLVFHDVDLIPLDERVLYTCPRVPTHMSPAVDYTNFSLQYFQLFGGVTSMTPKQYLAVNGYSNYYWDWGAEDDDMYVRLVKARLAMSRINSSIARFAALPHKKQQKNPFRYWRLQSAALRFKWEGLNTVQYRLEATYIRRLYTHMIVNIDPFNHNYFLY